jgi:hypothetical protein
MDLPETLDPEWGVRECSSVTKHCIRSASDPDRATPVFARIDA